MAIFFKFNAELLSKKIIAKSDLVHKILVSYVAILKYIKESISIDLVIELKSDKDNRKVILFSTKKLIYDFKIFYCDHTDEMKKIFNGKELIN